MPAGAAADGSALGRPPRMGARRLGADDAALACRALRALAGDRGDPPPDERRIHRFLARADNIFILASQGEEAIGFLVGYVLDRLDGDRPMVCLYEIGVAETHRGRGIGRTMVDVMLDVCESVDARKAWAVTNRSNVPAARLFRHTGAHVSAEDDAVYVWHP